ncbi:peptidase M20 domain-containing protein 2-like [Tropilaelaps mercedesae]|uniref:Peptidase M20 domain-containing protein 2 n=1 Tax=Tropilaelaps mercedesae TaxID=418985 RepID=A0A1V9XX74_9ACAR|nr:peptidase M20 domain-containing protein 2-like [Tropilaelaps mercedesae]
MVIDYASIEKVFTERTSDFQAVSDFIHENPELAFEEHKSHAFLAEKLAKEGFTVEEQYLKCETAFRATFEKASEFILHWYGHSLRSFLQIVVLGTPAEESGGGKQKLIDGGAFKDIDVAMMVHPANTANEITPLFIGVNVILAEFHGKAAHAAGYPWDGRNALDGAVGCYSALAMLRQHLRPNCKIHAIIKNGGAAANVIPEYSSLSIFYRAPTLREMEELAERVDHCVKAGALLSSTQATISRPQCDYQPLRSNATLAKLYKKYCEKNGMTFDDAAKRGTFVASSDVGNVSWLVPTIQPIFHIDAKGPNHSVAFTEAAGKSEAQKNTLIAAQAMAYTCADIFCESGLLVSIKEEFQRK